MAGLGVDIDELRRCAEQNRKVFDRVLAPYVALKIAGVAKALERGERNVWLDASGCVWCLFDDPAFVRLDSEASSCAKGQDDAFDLQVFWSMGDVVMPPECDAGWVAKRIADEAMRQLPKLGFHRCRQPREIDAERHEGVLFARSILNLV